jgi:hypothetical protein
MKLYNGQGLRFGWCAAMTILIIVLATGTLIACSAPSKPKTTLTPIGGQIIAGQDVTLESTSTDAKGITRVEFSVDDTVIFGQDFDPPQKTILLPYTWNAVEGQHTIRVRAFNADGLVGDPATMIVVVAAGPTPPIGPTELIPPTLPAPTLLPTPTGPTATAVPGCTNKAAFVQDVTVPDGTPMLPNKGFAKVWRMRNIGTCTWVSNYQFAFVNGTPMTAGLRVPVPTNVAPGQTVDLSVTMTAPGAPGAYSGQWQLRDASGAPFGPVMYVKINVVGPPQAAIIVPPNGFQGTTAAPVHVTFQGTGNTEVSSVSLYVNGAPIAKQTSRVATRSITGEYDWRPAPGNYELWAVVVDTLGQQSASAHIFGVITAAPPTPSCVPSINFYADRTIINVGEYTHLRWDVDCVQAVYLDGRGVPGHGTQAVSPRTTTTYTLHVIKKDGNGEDRQVTIEVKVPPPTDTPPPPQRRDINGLWGSGNYTLQLQEAIGCGGPICGVRGQYSEWTGGTPIQGEVEGTINVNTGAVTLTIIIPMPGAPPITFRGTVDVGSTSMCGTLTNAGSVCFTKQ